MGSAWSHDDFRYVNNTEYVDDTNVFTLDIDGEFTPNYRNEDAGIDIPFQRTYTIAPYETKKMSLDTYATFKLNGERHAFNLRERSSISKTPLIFRSGGLIDSGYNGQLQVVCTNLSGDDYIIESGTSLFQITTPQLDHNLLITYGDTCTENTERGTGGFGSTN